MSEFGNEDAGGVLARLMRGANLRRSVEVLKAPDESLAATVSALANTVGGWILIGPDPEDGWRSAAGFDAEAAVEAARHLHLIIQLKADMVGEDQMVVLVVICQVIQVS